MRERPKREITPAAVKQVIEAEDDFGHEMRVGNELSKAAESIPANVYPRPSIAMMKHGETYVDPLSGKDRQFDYRCQVVLNDGAVDEASVFLAIECKNLHESSPLVICGRGRTSDEAYHCYVETKYRNGHLFPGATKVRLSEFYPQHGFVGKSLVRLKQDKDGLYTEPQQDIYDRWSQAVTSAKELGRQACTHFKSTKEGSQFAFLLPVVVLPDGLLWQVAYDRLGRLTGQPERVEEGTLFITSQFEVNPGQPCVLTHIHFVTLKGFALLLQKFLKEPHTLQYTIFR
jgi:hypothetical protein